MDYLKNIFPDADKIFESQFKDFDKSKKNCIYVFDTNILFVPFLMSKKSLENYKNIFRSP